MYKIRPMFRITFRLRNLWNNDPFEGIEQEKVYFKNIPGPQTDPDP